jgi:hypothetical protein
MFLNLLSSSVLTLAAASVLAFAGLTSDGGSKAAGCACTACDCGTDCGCVETGSCDCGRGCCVDGCVSAQATEFAVAAVSDSHTAACCAAKEACCVEGATCCETAAVAGCPGCANDGCQAAGCSDGGCCEGACGVEGCGCAAACCENGCCAK